MKNIIPNKEIEKMLAYMEAAMEAVKDVNEAEFTCPICGSVARAIKAPNGHVHSACSQCGQNFMQ